MLAESVGGAAIQAQPAGSPNYTTTAIPAWRAARPQAALCQNMPHLDGLAQALKERDAAVRPALRCLS